MQGTVGDGGTVVVGERFAGPPGAGNGGYVSGVVASRLGHRAEVTLLRPTPLARPLALRRRGAAHWSLEDGDEVLVEARPGRPGSDVPPPPSFEQAVAASGRATTASPFPGCFVCGASRGEGDGLRIFAGALDPARPDRFAAAWVPDASLVDPSGDGRRVANAFQWAALDCPGAMAALADDSRPILLARMTGELEAPVHVDERCVVVAWRIARDGRKHTVGTALFGEDGTRRGRSEQLWIEPRRA